MENFTVQRIGNIEMGIDGRDEFVLVTNPEGNLTVPQAEDYILSRVYYKCKRAGSYYCTSAYGSQVKYRDNEVIVIIHHRYDV